MLFLIMYKTSRFWPLVSPDDDDADTIRFHTTTLVLCKTGVGVFESSRVTARSSSRLLDRSKQVWDTGPAEKVRRSNPAAVWSSSFSRDKYFIVDDRALSFRSNRLHSMKIYSFWTKCKCNLYEAPKRNAGYPNSCLGQIKLNTLVLRTKAFFAGLIQGRWTPWSRERML